MWKKILILFVVFFLIFSFAKDKILEVLVEKTCTFALGTRLEIGRMQVGIIKSVIAIDDLKLYNPEGYPYELMADVPEIYVEYDLPVILKSKVSLKELRFHLKEFNIVRDKDGQVNVDSLKPVKNKTSGEEVEKGVEEDIPDMDIQVLYLKAGKAYYRDYSAQGTEPVVREFNVELDEKYEDINDIYTLVRLIIYRLLKKMALTNIINIPMTGVKEVLGDAYTAGTQAVSATVQTAAGAAENVLGGAKNTLGGAAKELESLVVNPFSGGTKEKKSK